MLKSRKSHCFHLLTDLAMRPTVHLVKANYIARGVRAIFRFHQDEQFYEVTIRPVETDAKEPGRVHVQSNQRAEG